MSEIAFRTKEHSLVYTPDRNEIITKGLKKISVYDWMYRDLKLQGKELLVYAALYGMKDKKIFLTDAPIIYGYMKTDRSSFFRVRAALVGKGLIDVTEDEGEKYFYVSEPDLSQSENSHEEVPEPESETELDPEPEPEHEITPQIETADPDETLQDTSEVREMHREENPVQLDLLAKLPGSSDKNVGELEKTEKEASADEPGAVPVDTAERSACVDEETSERVSTTANAQQDGEPEDPAEADVITMERFCEEMGIEYDGTENTEGLDWGILRREYLRSEHLRSLSRAHKLKNIRSNYEAIKNGNFRDERYAEKAGQESEAAEKTLSD